MANVQPMRTAENQRSMDEADIRQSIESFMRAFRAKDLQGIIACYAPSVVAYDMMPPLRYTGIQAWEKIWEQSLAMMDGTIEPEIRDLTIDVSASGDLALCHGLNHFVLKGGKEAVDMWFRWTAGFRKINGKWLVTHEHTSVPSEMESGKSLTDLKP
jgi:ketosteroid isomerase-like protein